MNVMELRTSCLEQSTDKTAFNLAQSLRFLSHNLLVEFSSPLNVHQAYGFFSFPWELVLLLRRQYELLYVGPGASPLAFNPWLHLTSFLTHGFLVCSVSSGSATRGMKKMSGAKKALGKH